MIIRKPYAFLVNHFRKIHLIMLLPLLYLAYKSFKLMDFFNDYYLAGYKTTQEGLANIYYSPLITLSCIAILILCFTVISLFRKKNKGHTSYVIVSIVYSVLFLISLFIGGVLTSFESNNVDSAIVLMFRGFSSVFFYIQPVSILIFLFSGLGFNFKDFEFVNIKDEINLDEQDSEEVEVNVGVDNYKIKRGFRRYVRELKYYVIENKAYFLTFAGILGVIILFFVGKWIISFNRIVRVDKAFSHSSFSVTFNDSLLSTLDYNGKKIQDGKIYLAVKTTIKNNTNNLLALDTDNFWLDIDGTYYYPKLDRSGKFLDLAKPYYGDKVRSGQNEEIVLVYELDESLIKYNYKIKVLDSITYKKNEIIPKYKEITLKPKYSATINNNGTYSIGDVVTLSKTNLGYTTLYFSDYTISKTYQYTYQFCYNDECRSSMNSVTADASSVLLTLKGNIDLDSNCSYAKNKLSDNKFSNDFMKVEYTIGNTTNTVDVKDLTPSNSSGIIVLQTKSDVRNASSIKLIVTVRNERYEIVLKQPS